MTIQQMAQALKARDEGIASSANHAETDAPGWGYRAYWAVVESPYLANEPEWTMDFARGWLYACGLDACISERAWGSVTQKLLRDGKIERVGFDRSASSNGSFKPTYKLVR